MYNPGEYVEGFTNPLWTLLVAAGLALGFEAPRVAHVLGLGSGALALVATYWYAAAGLAVERRWLAALAPWIVLGFTPFSLWATSGMETPLFTAGVTAALAAQASGHIGAATAFLALATLTRPEGVLAAAIVFGFHLLASRGSGSRALFGPGSYLILLGLVELLRLLYYGSVLPNTFYAKIGGVPLAAGATYVLGFSESGRRVALDPGCSIRCPGAPLVARRRVRLGPRGIRRGDRRDAFREYRFLVPAIPVLAATSVVGATMVYERRRLVAFLLSLTIPAAMYWQVMHLDRARRMSEIRSRWELSENLGRRRARLLARRPPPALVTTGAMGAFGYYSKLPVLDIYGLVNSEIARGDEEDLPDTVPLLVVPGHVRSQAQYVFARKPDYILIPRRGSGLPVPAVVQLWSHPDLEQHYTWDQELIGYRRLPSAAAGERTP